MNQTLVGLFANREDADRGITRLLHAGISPQDVGHLDTTDSFLGAAPDHVLVWAEVAGSARGIETATMLLDGNALAVACLALGSSQRAVAA